MEVVFSSFVTCSHFHQNSFTVFRPEKLALLAIFICSMNNLDQFFLLKVSGREHTSFHCGNIMHPLVEYSLGSDVQFVCHDCRINCYFGRRKSW